MKERKRTSWERKMKELNKGRKKRAGKERKIRRESEEKKKNRKWEIFVCKSCFIISSVTKFIYG